MDNADLKFRQAALRLHRKKTATLLIPFRILPFRELEEEDRAVTTHPEIQRCFYKLEDAGTGSDAKVLWPSFPHF